MSPPAAPAAAGRAGDCCAGGGPCGASTAGVGPGAPTGAPAAGGYGRATLVICPLVAVIQWGQEIERFVAPNTLKARRPGAARSAHDCRGAVEHGNNLIGLRVRYCPVTSNIFVHFTICHGAVRTLQCMQMSCRLEAGPQRAQQP